MTRVASSRALFYHFHRKLAHIVMLGKFQVEFLGEIPKEGPFVVASVHRAAFDPPVIGVPVKRTMRYVAKKSLFSNRFIAAYIRKLGAIPVTRGTADLAAFRNCLAVLKRGDGLVIFPEGTRLKGKTVGPLTEGAILLAKKAKAPVIPVALYGTDTAFKGKEWILRRHKAKIVYGVPIKPDDLTPDLLREQMQLLLDRISN